MWFCSSPRKKCLMLHLLGPLSVLPIQFFRFSRILLLEKLVRRQQPAVRQRRHPQPLFAAPDKLFSVMLQRLWSGVESGFDSGSTRDRCSLVSDRTQVALDVAITASSKAGPEVCEQDVCQLISRTVAENRERAGSRNNFFPQIAHLVANIQRYIDRDSAFAATDLSDCEPITS